MMEIWSGSTDLPIYGFCIRALIVYIYIFLIVKILGQRTINAIDPIDFIFSVVIGDILGEPLSNGDAPLAGPFAAAAIISIFHLSLCLIALKTPRFRRIIEDEPIILIEKGKILNKQLRKVKMTIESLLMDLRLQNAADINEVDYAILESNGQISVIKKSQYNGVTPSDLNQPTKPKGYPTVLIEDGRIIHANLKKVGTIDWLRDQVRQLGFKNYTEIFLLTMDESGQFYVSEKQS